MSINLIWGIFIGQSKRAHWLKSFVGCVPLGNSQIIINTNDVRYAIAVFAIVSLLWQVVRWSIYFFDLPYCYLQFPIAIIIFAKYY